MIYYKDNRIIKNPGETFGKPRWVIIDKNGKVVNDNPIKKELKGLERLQKDGRGNHRSPITNKQIIETIRNFVEE